MVDETLRIFVAVGSGVGLGQLLLFWVARRSKKVDARDEHALNLESSFLAERREILISLRDQLTGEQARAARLETEKAELMAQLITLHKASNEVVAKYDFLRTLNPAANLPVIHLDAPAILAPDAPRPERPVQP